MVWVWPLARSSGCEAPRSPRPPAITVWKAKRGSTAQHKGRACVAAWESRCKKSPAAPPPWVVCACCTAGLLHKELRRPSALVLIRRWAARRGSACSCTGLRVDCIGPSGLRVAGPAMPRALSPKPEFAVASPDGRRVQTIIRGCLYHTRVFFSILHT
jgi:hypothetical protein